MKRFELGTDTRFVYTIIYIYIYNHDLYKLLQSRVLTNLLKTLMIVLLRNARNYKVNKTVKFCRTSLMSFDHRVLLIILIPVTLLQNSFIKNRTSECP